MKQVTVDIDQRCAIVTLFDEMRILQFVVEGLCHGRIFLKKAFFGGAKKGAEYSTEDDCLGLLHTSWML